MLGGLRFQELRATLRNASRGFVALEKMCQFQDAHIQCPSFSEFNLIQRRSRVQVWNHDAQRIIPLSRTWQHAESIPAARDLVYWLGRGVVHTPFAFAEVSAWVHKTLNDVAFFSQWAAVANLTSLLVTD